MDATYPHSKHISLFAAILITSNEVYILEVEAEDRRFTIFSTAGNISSDDCNFFGFSDFRVFKKQIQSELRDFALFLKNYPIDVKLANKASWIVVWKVWTASITKEELWIG